MSGIAKPLVHFTGAINATEQSKYIPIEHIDTIEAFDEVPSALNNNTASYYILVTLVYPNSFTKNVKVKFLTSTLRNTTLTNFKAAISTPVAGT